MDCLFGVVKAGAISTVGTFATHGVYEVCYLPRRKKRSEDGSSKKKRRDSLKKHHHHHRHHRRSSSSQKTDEKKDATENNNDDDIQPTESIEFVPGDGTATFSLPSSFYDLTDSGRHENAISVIATVAGTTILTGTIAVLTGHYHSGTVSMFGVHQPEQTLFALGFSTAALFYTIHNTQTALVYKAHDDAAVAAAQKQQQQQHDPSTQTAASWMSVLVPASFVLGTAASVSLTTLAVVPLLHSTPLVVSHLHLTAASLFFYSAALRNLALTTYQSQHYEVAGHMEYGIACDATTVLCLIGMPFAIAGSVGNHHSLTALAIQTAAGAGIFLHTLTV